MRYSQLFSSVPFGLIAQPLFFGGSVGLVSIMYRALIFCLSLCTCIRSGSITTGICGMSRACLLGVILSVHLEKLRGCFIPKPRCHMCLLSGFVVLLFRTLRLDNNKLSGLPEALLTLTSLTSLSLRHNNFSALPYRLGDLRCLQTLDLGENMLKTLPATMVSTIKTDGDCLSGLHLGSR